MNFGFFGIIDIAMIFVLLVVMFIGYKKGFLDKFLSLSKVLCGFIFSLIFCNSFSKLLIEWGAFYPSIYDNIYARISSSEILNNADLSASLLYQELGIPKFIADMLGKNIAVDALTISATISDNIAKLLMIGIAFLLLFFGTTIVFFILKAIVSAFRQIKLVRFVDGIFGIALYSVLYAVFIYVCFAILYLVIDLPFMAEAKEFLLIDMQLETSSFRISKYFYESNIIVNLFKMFL